MSQDLFDERDKTHGNGELVFDVKERYIRKEAQLGICYPDSFSSASFRSASFLLGYIPHLPVRGNLPEKIRDIFNNQNCMYLIFETDRYNGSFLDPLGAVRERGRDEVGVKLGR